MLAHFNANFNLHHGLFGKENETNFLNLFKNADVTNHTCHTGWEEKKQKLILTPTNYSEHVFKFSFHFKQSEDENGVGFYCWGNENPGKLAIIFYDHGSDIGAYFNV